MDIQRIRVEVVQAQAAFAYVEAHPTGDGGVLVKAAFQTSAGITYIAEVRLAGYPSQMPRVHVARPSLRADSPHRYNTGNICYLHPNYWNPGRHDLKFVLARTAKWLNKYDVWCQTNYWPGEGMAH